MATPKYRKKMVNDGEYIIVTAKGIPVENMRFIGSDAAERAQATVEALLGCKVKPRKLTPEEKEAARIKEQIVAMVGDHVFTYFKTQSWMRELGVTEDNLRTMSLDIAHSLVNQRVTAPLFDRPLVEGTFVPDRIVKKLVDAAYRSTSAMEISNIKMERIVRATVDAYRWTRFPKVKAKKLKKEKTAS